jgi:aminopeptidase N
MDFKVILTVCVILVAVRSFPFNGDQKDQDRLLSFSSIDKSSPSNFLWNSTKQWESDENSADDEIFIYRLPNDSRPIRYDLWLKTDVDQNDFGFSGKVKIHLKVVEATEKITLHYRRITIDKVDLLSTDGNSLKSNLAFDYQEPLEFLIVSLPRQFGVSEEFVLDISYHGELREDGAGFYRSAYLRNDEEDNEVWFATTQFQQTDARHAMPCYDGIRAVMNVQIQHGKSYNVISNMPMISRVEIPGTDYVTTKFEDTPPMQTYLLAFIVSDYTSVSNNEVDVPQRIFAKPQSIANGEGDFAASVVGPILRKFEEHFGIDYPLPKMDHAAITYYLWGAMENFGLITYSQGNLLTSRRRNSDFFLNRILETIAHEFAHQYFGNIVNPEWWSYTWLNEGFANLYQYYILELLYPDQDSMDRFRQDSVGMAIVFDTMADAKPLNHYVESPREIRSKFDAISYNKGGSVLRMFQVALGVETFTKGLNYYLTEMYYKAATPEDLHRSLQKAYDEDNPGNSLNIAEVMSTWEDQAGFPVVTVEKIADEFVLTQERSGGGDEIYSIPLLYTTKSQRDFTTTPKAWMKSKVLKVPNPIPSDWIIVNIHYSGYYQVQYERSIWTSLIDTLDNEHDVIPPVDRVQLFKIIQNSIRDDSLEPVWGLKILSSLDQESHVSVWNQAYFTLFYFTSNMFGTEALAKFQRFVQKLAEPHMKRLGYEEIEGESTADAALRERMLVTNCDAMNEECLKFELEQLKSFIATGTGEYTRNLCYALTLADSTTYQFVIKSLLRDSAVDDRWLSLYEPSCSISKENLRSYMELILDKTNNLNDYERRDIVSRAASKSLIGVEAALEFVEENYQKLDDE